MSRVLDVRFSRWWLVAVATVAMGVAGTYQFAWSSIRIPLGTRLGSSETAIGTVFTLFVVLQTTSQFPAGWVRDRWGPRVPMTVGALLLIAGYAGAALATNITAVYVSYGLAGIGVGSVYTVAINTPVKWFDERRGLATGIVGFAYAAFSFVAIPLIRGRITDQFAETMLAMAALVGVLTLLGVPFMRDPDEGEGVDDGRQPVGDDSDGTASEDEQQTGKDGGDVTEPQASAPVAYTWREAIRTWQFWLLYAVFILVNGVGLMVIAKVVAFAEAMSLPAAATGAASLVALGDGLGVLVGGSVSDRIGRERTIAGSLVFCSVALAGAALSALEGVALAFVALIAAAAFFRSPVFAVFPSLVGDYYGTSHSSENYAVLYSSKLWGGVVGGTVTSALIVSIGWVSTFLLGAVLLLVAGVGTYFLRPVERDAA